MNTKILAPTLLAISVAALPARAADLSPERWPAAEKQRIERAEILSWSPLEAARVDSAGGIVSATASPIAAQVGAETLRQGGTAADAAIAAALSHVATQLGSVVSYAGIYTMLYYEAETGEVHSLDAGFNSYLGETDPLTISASDLGALSFGVQVAPGSDKGRSTLVPGFMAGIEAAHERFGKLPFGELFAPAIWYCENGIEISPTLAFFFQMRQSAFARTPEGRAFMAQSGREIPQAGDRFIQRDLAETLKAIARDGARHVYAGPWAEAFVEAVARDGGKATAEDLLRYEPIWSAPRKTEVFGYTVYANGAPHYGSYALVAGLNLAEALELDAKPAYWENADSFLALSRVGQFLASAPAFSPRAAERLKQADIDASPEALLTKPFAKAAAPLLESLLAPRFDPSPKHSNAIVAIDRAGNIAVVTHTINAVVWGSSGIVVGGIPIPDSAGFQQAALAVIEPGTRLPHQILDTISIDSQGRPVLATASIGSSLTLETLRMIVGALGQGQDLGAIMAAPPLLASFPAPGADLDAPLPTSIPENGYDAALVAELKARLPDLVLSAAPTVDAIRGTLAAVSIDPASGKKTAVNQPGVMVFNAAE